MIKLNDMEEQFNKETLIFVALIKFQILMWHYISALIKAAALGW